MRWPTVGGTDGQRDHTDPPRPPMSGTGRPTDIGPPESSAAGLPAVLASTRHARREMGLRRSLTSLLKVNQPDGFDCPGCAWPESRSEEHTSELQSLMRLSYAVFCLTKKKT